MSGEASSTKIISINCNKRLATARYFQLFQSWLKYHDCDILLVQEPWSHLSKMNVEIPDYIPITGNSYVHSWVRTGVEAPAVSKNETRWQIISTPDLDVHNVYLDPRVSKQRTALLNDLREWISCRPERQVVIMGDFNMAPNVEDGRHGPLASPWTRAAEKKAFQALLNDCKLTDTTTAELLGCQHYTLWRLLNGKPNRFRCDLCLTSTSHANLWVAAYVHNSRIGDKKFTDHSAVVLSGKILH